MKDYEEMARSVLHRRDQYVIKRRRQVKRAVSVLSCLCLAVLLGVGVWRIGLTSETSVLDDGIVHEQLESDLSNDETTQAHQQQNHDELKVPDDSDGDEQAGPKAADSSDSYTDTNTSRESWNVRTEAEDAVNIPSDTKITGNEVIPVANISHEIKNDGPEADPGADVSYEIENIEGQAEPEPVINTSYDHDTVSAGEGVALSAEITAFRTFEEVIQSSDVAIVGRYVGIVEYDYYLEQKFSVVDCIYGDVPDDEIYLYTFMGPGYVSETGYSLECIDVPYYLGLDYYVEGMDYILIMCKDQSILYDHDRYTLADPLENIFLNQTDEEYSMKSEPIEIPAGMSMIDYISSVYDPVPQVSDVSPIVSYDSEMAELLGESKFVGVVNILELYSESLTHNGDVYRCSVDSLIVGENLNTYDDGTFLLVILKDTVEVGDSYVIGFTSSSDTSFLYTQTTTTSVYEVSDALLSEIYQVQASSQPIAEAE